MKTCAGCGAPMKIVPAGISKKTGEPYDEFEACSEKCGWRPSKENGVKKIVVESHLPTKAIPPEQSDLRERSMIMSYAKDIVVAMLSRDQIVGQPGKEVVDIFRTLWIEYKNPLKD